MISITTAVFSAVLLLSFGAGAVASRFVRDVSDYYVAGGRMPWYLLTGTFLASNVSAGLFLGATNMAGTNGYSIWSSYVPTSIGFVIAIAFVGVMVRRLSRHFEVYDFADILAARYCGRSVQVRALSAVLLPIVYIPILGAQFIALATITSVMFGLPYSAALGLIVLVVVGYTLLGGMLGVVWSDGMQLLVLFFGLVLAVPIGMNALGGGDTTRTWEDITAITSTLFDWTTPEWPWFVAIGQLFWLFAVPVQPHLVTRFLTARDEKTILITLPVCLIAGLIIYSSSVPIGLLGRLAQPDLGTGDYYYIALATNHLGAWLGAFALAGIAAAALSTCSTVLIVSGQSFSRELFEHWLLKNATPKQTLRLARAGVLLVGLLGYAIAVFQPLGIFWLVVLSASLLAAVYFVPLIAGFMSARASAAGALAAMLFGGITTLTVFFVNEALDAHYFISEAFAGLMSSAIGMWYFSRRFPPSAAERDAYEKCWTPEAPLTSQTAAVPRD
ncbi:sodium:solute symporter family protein [Elongatibacter sediminis]|uniref:Sodium:solute symporter family protein n=1 Tax=Elongatibacter sediminis TaxID=3119006 RepID=A0AAW9RCC7_9GAMM